MMPNRAKIRLHIQENPENGEFLIRHAHIEALLRANTDLSDLFDVSHASDREGLDIALRDAEILLASDFASEDLTARAPFLRWIQSTNAGVEKLLGDVPDRVVLTNASGVHARKASEFAMMALLMLNSQVGQMAVNQRAREWKPIFTPTIRGKTVVVLGCGRIGSAVADAARFFGMHVVGVNRTGTANPSFDQVQPIAALKPALQGADFLIITLPSTDETRNLVGVEQLSLLKKGAGVVNIGRGQVLDENALVDALDSGAIGGAVLDVFRQEPLPISSRLWTHHAVTVSPHCAIDDPSEYVSRACDIFIRNLKLYVARQPLENIVDRKGGY